VYSVDLLGSTMAQPLGQLSAGAVVAAIGLSAGLLTYAGLLTVVAVATLAVPSIRHLDR
jgi:hypothetical protein